MIPDEIHSKPEMRKLADRTPKEQALIAAALEKRRKKGMRRSSSVQPNQLPTLDVDLDK